MSEKKRYVLELTAEQVLNFRSGTDRVAVVNGIVGLAAEIERDRAQAKADRDGDDLRLPWSARFGGETWELLTAGKFVVWTQHERMAKLAAAAPELLEAVLAWRLNDSSEAEDYGKGQVEARRLTERAMSKLATGQPEPI